MIVIGVMGAGRPLSDGEENNAFELGRLLAKQGWVVLTGGRDAGVMDAASRGAKAGGGITVGVLPSAEVSDVSAAVDIPIVTGMGHARNAINVLSSDVVIACGDPGAGTASEVSLAIKSNKPVILLGASDEAAAFFRGLGKNQVVIVTTPEEAVIAARQHLLR